MTPTEWFDQFPPTAEGVEWPADSQWCARHWAPCPILGANGIGASVEIQQIFLNEIASSNAKTADALNREMQAVGRICCTLGDERMYALWGKWGPA